MINFSKNLKKGVGLVEVLIALVIISSSMVLAIRTVGRALNVAKENEVRDTAAGILFSGYELTQLSDAEFNVSGPFSSVQPINLSGGSPARCVEYVPGPLDGGLKGLVENTAGINCPTQINDCAPQPPYQVTTFGDSSQELDSLVCQQVLITNYLDSTDTQTSKYVITSTVVYEVGGEFETQSITTVRAL